MKGTNDEGKGNTMSNTTTSATTSAEAMTCLQMCDRLDATKHKLLLLSEIFQSQDMDTDACHDGLAYLIGSVFEDVAEVADAINERMKAEEERHLRDHGETASGAAKSVNRA